MVPQKICSNHIFLLTYSRHWVFSKIHRNRNIVLSRNRVYLSNFCTLKYCNTVCLYYVYRIWVYDVCVSTFLTLFQILLINKYLYNKQFKTELSTLCKYYKKVKLKILIFFFISFPTISMYLQMANILGARNIGAVERTQHVAPIASPICQQAEV